MSADDWKDCPKCGSKDSVRIDGIWDYDLLSNGSILHNIRGNCKKCGLEFKANCRIKTIEEMQQEQRD